MCVYGYLVVESLLGQLLDIVRDVESPVEVIHLAFKLMYLITKVIYQSNAFSFSGEL